MPHLQACHAGGKTPERTLQKSSGVLRLMGIYFCNGKGKEKCSLCKEGNEDPSTVSQIQVMLANCAKTQIVFKTDTNQRRALEGMEERLFRHIHGFQSLCESL